MKHFTTPDFWDCYKKLPLHIQEIADKNFALLKNDSQHPSLHFKKIGEFYSVRIGLKYRALGIKIEEGILWFWIGNHDDYEKLINT